MVTLGCPTTTGSTCIGGIANSSSSKNIDVNLTAGQTNYIMFDTWPTPDSPCPGTFSMTPTAPPSGCGGNFYDSGGVGGNYSNNENKTTTIYPDNSGDVVSVSFTAFDTEQGWDGLMIYDGPDASYPVISSGSTYNRSTCPNGAWTGIGTYSAEGLTFTSSDPSGALTFVFTSDASVNYSGWEASISCAPGNDECSGAINLTPTPGIFTNPGTQSWGTATMTGSPAPTCSYTYKKDLWYVLTTDSDGNQGEKIKLAVSPSSGYDIAIELYTGDCVGGLTSVMCKDTAYNGGTEIIYFHEPNTPPEINDEIETRENTKYYLRVMLWTSSSGGTFEISATGSTALLVNLISFSARALNGKEVGLNWKVAAESALDGYIVEHGTDGRNFEAIGKVKAAQMSAYAFVHDNPAHGINYYRLRMLDDNGAFKLSEVRQVVFSNGKLLTLYPNPTSGLVYIAGLEVAKGEAVVVVYNEMGQEVWSGKIGGDELASKGIDMSMYPAGAYMIRVISDEVNSTMRFVKE